VIQQGEVYWIDLGMPVGSAPGYRRPGIVVQNDGLNATGLRTVVVVTLTTNLRRSLAVGNVLLREGEAGLPKPSVVNVTQILTVDRSQLAERIGMLSRRRVLEIIDGIRLVLEPIEP